REALDPDQIADLYAEDAVAVDVAVGTELQGREAIRAYLVEFIGAFSDASAEVPTVFAAETQAAMEWIFQGRYTGALPGFPPGEGQPVTLHGFSLVEFSEDAIQRTVDFYDVYGILVQLGVVPPPAGATPAG
ncbi:MAG TPA: ester cyclase, partial [Thermomicrobiales bacterium]|nr:ester cyclase [Thermomicrobiales bacterium]